MHSENYLHATEEKGLGPQSERPLDKTFCGEGPGEEQSPIGQSCRYTRIEHLHVMGKSDGSMSRVGPSCRTHGDHSDDRMSM